MRIIIAGFICGLIITTNIYAAANEVDNQAVVGTDMFAAPSQNSDPTTLGSSTEVSSTLAASGSIHPEVVAPTVQAGAEPSNGQDMTPPTQPEQPKIALPVAPSEQPPASSSQGNIHVDVAPAGENAEPRLETLSDRLMALEIQNTQLQTQITQMKERINLVEERLIGNVGNTGNVSNVNNVSEQKTQECFYCKLFKQVAGLKDRIGARSFTIAVSIVIVVFLLLLMRIIFPRRRSCVMNYPKDNLLNKAHDFNPMEGQEGVTAKLNLARAYIEMGNENKAHGVLQDVLIHGNDEEQEEAKALLEKIKHL